MKKVYLICNSHIDPAWQWEWEEGASAAIATFNSAVNLLDEYDFIFCHNESILYEWIKEYDKPLYARIKEKVSQGKWKIIGGWYIQPDCNIPCGESFIRQVMTGRRFFREEFPESEFPSTAISFDAFGHSGGLPQILTKCGYQNYLFCRPNRYVRPDLPEEYIWEGADGSRIRCYHSSIMYCSLLGEAAKRIKEYTAAHSDMDTCLVLWGVGNHGGGPSREDLEAISALQREGGAELIHSFPDEYFNNEEKALPVVSGSLTNFAPGCYTSMVLIKQKHFQTENLLFFTETISAVADLLGLEEYDAELLERAEKNLLFSQFHDILPGTGIREVEDHGLQLLYSAQEWISKVRARAFFALCRNQKKAEENTYPHFVFNPHPYPLVTEVEIEFSAKDIKFLDERFEDYTVYSDGAELPSQLIKERSVLNHDWRKRLAVYAALPPLSLTRLDCVPKEGIRAELPRLHGDFVYGEGGNEVRISGETGLLVSYRREGREYLGGPAAFEVISDTADSWALSLEQTRKIGERKGEFRLMTVSEAEEFCAHGQQGAKPLMIVEDGSLYTKVQTLLAYGKSTLKVDYTLLKKSFDLRIEVASVFTERNKMLKLRLPCSFPGSFYGGTAFGVDALKVDGEECAAQRWVKLCDGESALALINEGTYGCSSDGRSLEMTLVRTPVYCCHYVEGFPLTVPDRAYDHIDIGERLFRFRLTAGASAQIGEELDAKAAFEARKPYTLNLFPQGDGKEASVADVLSVSSPCIILSAFKKSRGGGYILRLYNSLDRDCETVIHSRRLNIEGTFKFSAYEVRTFRVFSDRGYEECALMEV